MDMKKVMESAASQVLDAAEERELDEFLDTLVDRYPQIDVGIVGQALTNSSRYYHLVREANSGTVAADIDVYRDISNIITAKFYVGSVLNQLASTQVLENPFGYIYRLEFEYADAWAADGINANDPLNVVRSASYANDPGEGNIPRRLKAELKHTLVDTAFRPIDISSTFQSIIRMAGMERPYLIIRCSTQPT